MKTRKEVAEYINSGECMREKSEGDYSWAHHFGKHELRRLMDFIYESEPEENEKITNLDKD